MAAEEIGSMVCEPVLFYDFVVPDFLNWSKDLSEYFWWPEFHVKNKKFKFGFYPNNVTWTGEVPIWLCCLSVTDPPIVLARFSLSLIGNDGSEKQICSKANVTFEGDYLDDFEPDAKFAKANLDPDFLPNGELRIRCRIEIKSNEISPVRVVPKDGFSLVEDLRKEFAEGTMAFTDFVLVKFYNVLKFKTMLS